MKYFLLFLSITSLLSCKHQNEKSTSDTDHFIDSMKIRERVDSMVKATMHKAAFDTTGLWQAPVKVLSAKLVKQEYSNRKNIWLAWKNVSDKKISAIRFKWYGINAFNEPADMGSASFVEGFGGGFAERNLSSGKTDNGEWEIYSKDGKKVVLAWPYEVAFMDGSIWKLSNN